MKKKLIAICLCILILSAVCVCAFATQSEGEAALEFMGASLVMESSVNIRYVIDVQNANPYDVEILVFTQAQNEYVKGAESYTVKYSGTTASKDGQVYYCFDFDGVSAKQMTDNFYAVAYLDDGDSGCYSDVCKYSVLQYVHNIKSTTESGTLNSLLDGMLEYGALAQTHFNYKADRLANAEFYQLSLDGGVLDDGFGTGLYTNGEAVTISAPLINAEGASFSYWRSGAGTVLRDNVTEITMSDKDESYTAVYVKYTEGLEFETNDDGTCCLVGIGDFTGTELVIPPTSPDGDRVTEIDSSVFAGEELVSVSFPSTIEAIGRRAFNNCDSIADVYYDGTEEQWAEVSISSGNDAILNATMHYSVSTTYQVVFADYDGAVLKTETVIKGESATAPAAPSREGYVFSGWDTDFSCVEDNLTVTATYTPVSSDPTIVVSSADAVSGEEGVQITVALRNNPGVASLNLLVTYDSGLELAEIVYNSEIGGMNQLPQEYDSPVILNWFNGTANTEGDWVFATLTFNVSDAASVGEYAVSVSYEPDNIYNINEENINFDVVDGVIRVTQN